MLVLAAAILALGLAASLWRDHQSRAGGGGEPASTGVAAVGGPFQLVDQNGRAANESLLKGKWTALFFGYTYCPDVCPATLSMLKAAKDRLHLGPDDLQVVFVTVDPERDTPAQLRTYLSSPAFPRPITGLTGTPEQIAAMAKAYKVYYAKRPMGSTYLMDHASAVYLIGPDGRFRTLVSDSDGLDSMVASIAGAIGRS
jgi:protein SCO1/2